SPFFSEIEVCAAPPWPTTSGTSPYVGTSLHGRGTCGRSVAMKYRIPLFFGLALALVAGLCADEPAKDKPKPDQAPPKAGAYKDERSGWPDSFKYYGPNGLWKTWNESQRLGRDTWIYWTGGNQKFLRLGTLLGGQQQVPISIEYFRLLDSRHRGDRFKKLGLI